MELKLILSNLVTFSLKRHRVEKDSFEITMFDAVDCDIIVMRNEQIDLTGLTILTTLVIPILK